MGAGSPGFGRDELATSIGSIPVEAEASQRSLADLTNDTARDATDFATEIGRRHSGCQGYRHAKLRALGQSSDDGVTPRGAQSGF